MENLESSKAEAHSGLEKSYCGRKIFQKTSTIPNDFNKISQNLDHKLYMKYK